MSSSSTASEDQASDLASALVEGLVGSPSAAAFTQLALVGDHALLPSPFVNTPSSVQPPPAVVMSQ
jgi:hypothetical protein